MEHLTFYPKLTNSLVDRSECVLHPYTFTYYLGNTRHQLNPKYNGDQSISLDDPNGLWDLEKDGLYITKRIRIDQSAVLFGADGIAPLEADVGVCILWTNIKLAQRGVLLPIGDGSVSKSGPCEFCFSHIFEPNNLTGNLLLEITLYIKAPSLNPRPNEMAHFNEQGAKLGVLETTLIRLGKTTMDFPVYEVKAPGQPLWQIEFNDWDDPRVDLFGEDSFGLYLNTAYPECPSISDGINNKEMLIEIISMAYYLIFAKIDEYQCLEVTRTNTGLEPNSICSVMYQFSRSGKDDLVWSSPESLLLSIQKTVRSRVRDSNYE